MFRFYATVLTSVAILLAPAIARAGVIPAYSINALGAASPRDINNAGQIVGNIRMSDGSYQAVIYSGSGVRYLGTLDGAYSYANAINNLGEVVGYAEVAGGGQAAFLYNNGTMKRIDGLGNSGSWAYDINDKGDIVGTSNGGPRGSYVFEAGAWGIRTLGGLLSGLGIGESGTVVGEMPDSYFPAHAASYTDGVVQDLGTLGGAYGVARKINEKDQIVGVSYTAGNTSMHAFLYSDGLMADLGLLRGSDSDAYDINNSGQVVGDVRGANYRGGGTGFVYSNGIMNDLNMLVDPAAGWTIYQARAINDSGQIAAWGCSNNFGCQTLRLDPTNTEIPEPGTLGLFSISIFMLAVANHGHRSKRLRRHAKNKENGKAR